MHEEQTEALIVGGGAAGLAAAIELTDRGIEPIVLERRPGFSSHPRATVLTAPAMQLMWRWGVADEVSRQGYPAEPAMSVRTSLTAPEVQRVQLAEHVWSCPQDRIEEILSVRATAGGARIRYGTALIGLRPAGGAVTATAATTDGVSAGIRAGYVIGADGARSTVRQSCGITTTRLQQAGFWLSIMFRAPLRDYVSDPPFMLYRIKDGSADAGLLVPADGHDRWIRCLPWHPEFGELLADYEAPRCIELVRSAAGVDDLPVRVMEIESFQLASMVADQFRAGRVLLAGDAARVLAPTAGPGMSLALQDGSAAAQAVADVLGGSQAALDEYEARVRQPVTPLLDQELLSY